MHDCDKPQWHRNQLVAALWRYTVTTPHWGADSNHLVAKTPSVFQSRVKKMLNLDRIPSMTPWKGLGNKWAFYDEAGEGTGSEELFSTFHAFMMGMAMELMNIGLKQSEVIFFLKHMRPGLHEQFVRVHARSSSKPPISGGARSTGTIQNTVWMVVRRIETQEAHPGFQKKVGGRRTPLFLEPEFFEGFEAVHKRIARQPNAYRHTILIEIADSALALPRYLREAPAVRRGRPAAR